MLSTSAGNRWRSDGSASRLGLVTLRTPTLTALRRTCGEADPEGLVRLLFVRDRGRVALVQTAHETADNADQFLVRYLADMIRDVAAPGVVLTIWRCWAPRTGISGSCPSLMLKNSKATAPTVSSSQYSSRAARA